MGTHILHRNADRTSPESKTPKVFLFPGQSSAGPEMSVAGARVAHAATEPIADCARAVLGDERASRYLTERGATLDSNRDIQITVFLATQMYLAALTR